MTRARRIALPLGLLALGLVAIVVSARQSPPSPAEAFEVSEAMIPMRDGASSTPRSSAEEPSGPLPFIFIRTPYGIDGAAGNFARY